MHLSSSSQHLEAFYTMARPGEWESPDICAWVRSWAPSHMDEINSHFGERRYDRKKMKSAIAQALEKGCGIDSIIWSIFAWGRMKPANITNAQNSITELVNIVSDGLSRRPDRISLFDAYARASYNKRIPGVGPAYYTKIMYFLGNNNSYIMDQWVAKSINLVTGQKVVTLTSNGYVCTRNSSSQYGLFCEIIDSLSRSISNIKSTQISGDWVEESLFSQGGTNAHPWRRYVREHWHQS